MKSELDYFRHLRACAAKANKYVREPCRKHDATGYFEALGAIEEMINYFDEKVDELKELEVTQRQFRP